MKKFSKYYLPVILWMAVIFSLSSLEGTGISGERTFWFYAERKGAHIFEYFILSIFLIRALKIKKIKPPLLYFFAAGVAGLYAFSDELHQTFVFGREGKFLDILIDLVGIILAVALVYFFKKYAK